MSKTLNKTEKSNTKTPPIASFYKRAFSLVELIVVVAIIGILSGTAYIGIQKGKTRMYNDKILDDIIGIANALERYNHDHWGEYPVPSPNVDSNMNISCFYADATYAHDCDTSAFRQGMIDNNLLTRRYMPEVPTDPRTGSRYVYGVSTDGKYFMVGGIYEESDGSFVAKTAGNLKKGYHLPSLIRAFNGPNFVVEDGTNLPYSPDHLIITATLQNMPDSTEVGVTDAESNTVPVTDGMTVYTGYTITTNSGGTVDIYYSDGSISNLDTSSSMKILEGTEVEENDKDGIITKIRIKLTSGKIWNKVARLASASEFNVETTTAIAGVRGTEFGVDATENQVLLKSGEICRMDLVEDIPVENVKTCTGSYTIAGLDDAAGPVIIGMDAGGTATPDTPTTEPLKTLMDEQSKRYLNDNIRPHILKVEEGGVITVANLGTYYSLPELVDLEVDGLVAHPVGGGAPVGSLEASSFTPEGDYELTIDALAYNIPIVLRFEKIDGPSSGDSIPITITADTNLTEEDLYGIPESVEWVDPYEEIIICDATTMVIAGDATFAPGSVDTKDVTLVWSVTPVECFEGAAYSGEAGPEGGPLTSLTITSGSMQSSLGEIGNGSEYEWNITASVGSYTYRFPTDVSTNAEFTVPAGDVYCGNSLVDGEEECDNSHASIPGCISIGADACKCNIDLGWTPDGSGGCVCDFASAAITLPDYTTVPIPINSSLTWEVSPACAFDGESYAVFVNSGFVGEAPSTSFSLTIPFIPMLIPGDIYNWKIFGAGVYSPIGSFEVVCPSVGTIDNVVVTVSADTPTFDWSFNPACTFGSANTTITISGGVLASPVNQITVTSGDTSLTWNTTLTPSASDYTYTLSTTDPVDTETGTFTIAPAVTIEADITSIVVVGEGPYNFKVWDNTSTDVTDSSTCTISDPFYGSVINTTAGYKEFYPTSEGNVDITCDHTLGTDIVTVVILSAAEAACYGGDLMLGGTTADAGYWDGSACWVLGSAGDSCDVACPDILGSGFLCNTDLTWNDVGCSICNQFGVDTSGGCSDGGTLNAYPLYQISGASEKTCFYRNVDPLYTVDCSITRPSTQRRICKCQ